MKSIVAAIFLASVLSGCTLPTARDCYPGASPECRGLTSG